MRQGTLYTIGNLGGLATIVKRRKQLYGVNASRIIALRVMRSSFFIRSIHLRCCRDNQALLVRCYRDNEALLVIPGNFTVML